MLNIEKTLKVTQKRYDDLIATRDKRISVYNDAVNKNNTKCNDIIAAAKEKYAGLNANLKTNHEAELKELKPQIDDALRALNKAKEMAEVLRKFNEQENI